MSRIINPTEKLTLKVPGDKKILLNQDQYYILERRGEQVPVIKHDSLIAVADQNGYKIDKTVLEFGIFHNSKNFCFVHRAFGSIKEGMTVEEVGEANPANLETAVSAMYPAIMSNKRAQDRLLIRMMGLQGQVYSDSEFGKIGGEGNDDIGPVSGSSASTSKPAAGSGTKPASNKKETPSGTDSKNAKSEEKAKEDEASGGKNEEKSQPDDKTSVGANADADADAGAGAETPAGAEAPVSGTGTEDPASDTEEDLTTEKAKNLQVDYGRHRSNPITLGDLREKYPNDFEWLLNGYTPRPQSSAKMKLLHSGAKLLAAS